ncbi:MAG: molybdopterin molybdotransferase MoeA [Anaerolineae bacterium]
MANGETYPLLSVEEARERVLSRFRPLPAESVPILESLGRVLAEDIVADMDIPPLSNSAMDGYAVRASDIAAAPARLRVVAEIAAGQASQRILGSGEAIRIMTGAVIPDGADAVVRFEDAHCDHGWVEVLRPVQRGANIRLAGEDVLRGSIVLSAGTVIRPQEVGMLASVGQARVQVRRRPRVAVLATGNELVEIGETVEAGKIRNTNSYSNAAQVLQAGGVPLLLGIAHDCKDELAAKLRLGQELGVDLFITSGGVSVGDFDLVKEVLASEGNVDFWWVNMKPGKPVAFGAIGNMPLLGLPGNPVAAMISFELFARPAILKMLGHSTWERPFVQARLHSAILRKDGRRHYLRVRLLATSNGWEAELTGDQGSGILTSMVQAHGLAIIPEDCSQLPAGSEVRVMLLD